MKLSWFNHDSDEGSHRFDLVSLYVRRPRWTRQISLGAHYDAHSVGLGLDAFHERGTATSIGVVVGPVWVGMVTE